MGLGGGYQRHAVFMPSYLGLHINMNYSWRWALGPRGEGRVWQVSPQCTCYFFPYCIPERFFSHTNQICDVFPHQFPNSLTPTPRVSTDPTRRPLFQMAATNGVLRLPTFLPNLLHSEVLMTLPLGLIIPYNDPRKCFIYRNRFVMKHATHRNSQWKRVVGQGMGRGWGTKLPCPLLACHSQSTYMCLPTWKLYAPLNLGVFMKVPLRGHDWWIHWSLVINSVSSPFPLPRGWGSWRASSVLYPLKQGRSPPRTASLQPRCSCHPYHSENPKGFKKSLPGPQTKTRRGFPITLQFLRNKSPVRPMLRPRGVVLHDAAYVSQRSIFWGRSFEARQIPVSPSARLHQCERSSAGCACGSDWFCCFLHFFCIYCSEFFSTADSSLSSSVFYQSFLIWTHGHLRYSLGINLFLICTSNSSSFDLGAFFGWLLYPFGVFFLALPYSLAPWDAPGFFYTWPAPAPELALSMKIPGFFYWKTGLEMKIWVPGACCCRTAAFRGLSVDRACRYMRVF